MVVAVTRGGCSGSNSNFIKIIGLFIEFPKDICLWRNREGGGGASGVQLVAFSFSHSFIRF